MGIDWWSRLWRRKPTRPDPDPNWPDWYRRYYDAFVPTPTDTAYPEICFTVFDTEATGMDPRRDRLLSLGAIKLRANALRAHEVFRAYTNPAEAHEDTTAVVIHGLVPGSTQRQYQTEAEVLDRFLAYLGSEVLVAHYLDFDLTLVNRALARQSAGPILNAGVDTATLARRLNPSSYWTPESSVTLDALARRHNVPLHDRHTAVGDSFIAAQLLMKMGNKLAKRRRRTLRLDDLLR